MTLEARIAQLESEIKERQELVSAYRRVQEDQRANNGQSEPDVKPEAAKVSGDEGKMDTGTEQFSWRSANPSGAVRNAIRHMTGHYSLNNIEAWLKHNGFEITRENISFILSRFAKNEEIKVHKKGAGKRPTVYVAT